MNNFFRGFILILIFTSQFSCKKNGLPYEIVTSGITQNAVDSAHTEIWRRNISPFGTLYDYTGLDGSVIFPTAQECEEGMPNQLGWGVSIDNGSLWGGLYIGGLIKRWQYTHDPTDSFNVRKIANGLILLGSVSTTNGFVARGVSNDAKSHYHVGAADQTSSWFLGLWQYLQTDIPTKNERITIQNLLLNVAYVIINNGMLLPSEPPINTAFQGYNPYDYSCIRIIFTDKICFEITHDSIWYSRYSTDLNARQNTNTASRLEIIKAGLPSQLSTTSTYTRTVDVCMLRILWEIESDTAINSSFKQGLEISSMNAVSSLANAYKFPYNPSSVLNINWRIEDSLWTTQTNLSQALVVANADLANYQTTNVRTVTEALYVREPIFAAYLISLSPDLKFIQQHLLDIEQLIQHYRYSKIYDNWFFPVECTWWRLKQQQLL